MKNFLYPAVAIICVFTSSLCSIKERKNINTVNNFRTVKMDSTFHLNANSANYVMDVNELDMAVDQCEFLHFEITKVVNPERYPVTIQVCYIREGKETILGDFGLFPADNPGKFLVANSRRIKSQGNIVLKLAIPDDLPENADFDVTLKSVSCEAD